MCVLNGIEYRDAGFVVIKDNKQNIIAQSYMWRGYDQDIKRVLVLDSFEYL